MHRYYDDETYSTSSPFPSGLLLVTLLFSSPLANACIVGERADPNDLDRYSHVISGKVDSFEWVESIWRTSDLTPPYIVQLSGFEALHGKLPRNSKFIVGPGCGLFVPEEGDRVVLFFEKKRSMIIPMPPESVRFLTRKAKVRDSR